MLRIVRSFGRGWAGKESEALAAGDALHSWTRMFLDPRTSIGAVHLTVADLDRSVRFYQTHLGCTLHERDDVTARLGAGGPDLVVLTESSSARRRCTRFWTRRSAGERTRSLNIA